MRSLLFRTVAAIVFLSVISYAQKPPEQTDEVIRIKTELVQTDVSVVDKQGRFVGGLTPEQFELRIDGRVRPITLFEHVKTGSRDEEKQLAASRNPKGTAPAKIDDTAAPGERVDNRGRIIFFFVDDVHLEQESLGRVRAALLRFVEKQMTNDDRVAIISASGQVGFLQQLTDNRAVLREAIDRLHFKRNIESTSMKVPISEVDANLIANHRDVRLFQYLVEATQNEFQTDLMNAALLVRQRIRQINAQSRPTEMHTLYGLENLMRSSAPLVGRKLVFFISDGFVVDLKKSAAPEILHRVITEAARVGAVVYTMDSRAMFSDPAVDATRNLYMDFSSRQGGRLLAESKMPQEVLETLAADTGGLSFLNPNDFDGAFAQAIRETSDYYLLDWRPEAESQRSGKAQLEVIVKSRPDLRVRVRRHLFEPAPEETTATKPSKATTPEDELRAALGSLYPHKQLPTSLSAGYVKTPNNETMLNVAMQLDGTSLSFEPTEPKQEEKKQTEVDVLGIALDDRGSFSSFRQKLTVTREAVLANDEHSIQWSQALTLPPGLYQVRVAVRERDTGRIGSALQWLEIPKLDAATIGMSDIFIGERKASPNASQKVAVNIDRKFARSSSLRYQAYLYSPAHTLDRSGIALEVKVLRGSRDVITVPVTKPGTTSLTNATSFPVAGEISLNQFPPGQYTLQISVTEKTARTTVLKQIQFAIE